MFKFILLAAMLMPNAIEASQSWYSQWQNSIGTLSFQRGNDLKEVAGTCTINYLGDSLEIIGEYPRVADHIQLGFPVNFPLTASYIQSRPSIHAAQRLADGAILLCGYYGKSRNISREIETERNAVEITLRYNCGMAGMGQEIVLTTRCEF